MGKMMGVCGTAACFLGGLVCILAVAGRFIGTPSVLGFQAINVFIVGVGLMVLGCLKKLHCISKG